MRLISQDGLIDVNYDNSSLVVGFEEYKDCAKSIISYYDHSSRRGTPLAEYNSKDKALKVMEMLRNSYVGMPVIMQNVEVADEVIEKLKKQNVIYSILPEEKSSIEYVNNAIFKFPADEEVEV